MCAASRRTVKLRIVCIEGGEVICGLSVDKLGSDIPKPPRFTLCHKILGKPESPPPPPQIERGRRSLSEPPRWGPRECQLQGQSFAGNATRVGATSPIMCNPTGDITWIFYLGWGPHGTMPPLMVAPMPPTLNWDPYIPPDIISC